MDFNEPLLTEHRKLDYLRTELNNALVFLEVAGASTAIELRQRNQRHGREAYESALQILAAVSPDAARRTAIYDKLALVRTRLKIERPIG